ncbi:uncharacterized protein LOC100897433 [Galendromus occidentalis]|uniref:Uncharacterized protein LOC100897433 n=1 Tax=Galendromus occidentalis TaxID=34638 RepID=A0AAJ6QPZ9_9ACAR|nr:uncharacterized protein LOC100897433 [Galendromus occidentalis]
MVDKCTVLLLAVAFMGSLTAAQSCHLRELDLCSATLLLFNQNPSGVATTDNELDKQCGFLGEAQQCFKNFTNRCATPLQRELMSFATEGSNELLKEFCERGSKIRVDYLKHAPCLGQTQPDQKKCLNDVQVGLERITAAKYTQRIPTACCVYARHNLCTTAAVEKKCGREAVEFGQLLMKMAASNLPDTICMSYKENPICDELLPPKGTKSTGKSNSVLSRLFSAYLGN